MKRKLLAIILAALALCMLGGFSLGGNAALLGQGIITAQEYELLERYDFELPEREQLPLDGFVIGEITTCVIGEQG